MDANWLHAVATPHSGISPDVIQAFEQRRQHAFNKLYWCVPDELKSGRLLDIGCGIGNGLVAGLQIGFKSTLGVDRDLNEFVWFKPDMFVGVCRHYGVDPAKAKLIEGNIFEIPISDTFDVVLMLDSIEHVPDPMAFIDKAASFVAPGGVLLIDTCPLFYSTAGAHLFSDFPPEQYPWVHLRKDFDDLCRERGVSDWSMQRYHELNKVTHDQIRSRVIGNGLTIIHEDRGKETAEARVTLETHRPILNLSGIMEHLLFEDWILLVGRRTVPLAGLRETNFR